jgi:glycyl-tRNA synthetase beta chain
MAKKRKPPLRRHELLVEIGTEELPALDLAAAAEPDSDLFRRRFRDTFDTLNKTGSVALGDLAVYLTPRRIVLHTKDLAFRDQAVRTAVYGPPVAQAYEGGQASAVLRGFIQSKGIRREDLEEFEHRGKKVVGFWKSESPKPLPEWLAELVPAWLRSLSFPKVMKWDDSDLRFPRPIRSVLVLLDTKPVKFPVGNLVAGGATRLFRNGERKVLKVKSAPEYFRALKKAGVLLDAAARRKAIEEGVERLTAKLGGSYRKDEDLLTEVVYLTETPVPLAGGFDERYLELPPEVLTASLSKKQRLFSVLDRSGRHLAHFIGVLDGPVQKKEAVAATMGAILRAKLQDSHFFFEEDAKIYRRSGPASGVEKLQLDLKHLVYLKDMGTVFDKVNRMREAATELGRAWGLEPSEAQDLERAARYSKSDLLTQMVGEFPELQGTMGGIYLRFSGKNDAVASAVGEQYLPGSAEGPLPRTRLGAALAILDKADLVVSCFIVGKAPTSSQDPYALKRSMTGIFRTAIAHGFPVSWERLAGAVIDGIRKGKCAKPFDEAAVKTALRAFYRERAQHFFVKSGGYRDELVEAVLAAESDCITAAQGRLEALSKLESVEAFRKTVKVLQRTANILKSADGADLAAVKPQAFREDLERQLYEKYESQKPPILQAISDRQYDRATSLYADAFFDILHVFFEKVLVNVPEIDVRRNRLALLAAVKSLYSEGIADLSKFRPTEPKESGKETSRIEHPSTPR